VKIDFAVLLTESGPGGQVAHEIFDHVVSPKHGAYETKRKDEGLTGFLISD
jgi:hypothetical protein